MGETISQIQSKEDIDEITILKVLLDIRSRLIILEKTVEELKGEKDKLIFRMILIIVSMSLSLIGMGSLANLLPGP